MARLIKVTQADPGHGSYVSPEVLVNVTRILVVEEYNMGEAHSRVYLENGKSLYVTETQDEILEMANSADGSSGGLF